MASEPSDYPGIPLVGIGTDIHAFEEGRELWCAGLKWEGEGPGARRPLRRGRRRARRVQRAVLRRGTRRPRAHFGTGRPEWSGASGITLLTEAARIVREAGFGIGNIAVQVVGPRPKIGKRRDEAQNSCRRRPAPRCRFPGPTTDGLGFPGATRA